MEGEVGDDPVVIFDADRHVMEPFEIWRTYLDPAMRHEAPTLEPDRGDGPPGETLGGRMARLGPAGGMPLAPVPCWRGEPIWRPMSEAVRIAVNRGTWPRINAMREASHGPGQLASMDRQGVAGAALLPTFAGFLVGIDEMPAAVAHAFAAAYNRWLADVCAADPARLVPVGLLARHDPARMISDLDGLLRRGWRAVVLRPEPVGGRGLDHPELAGFWARCAEADVAVILHGSTRARVPAAGSGRFTSQFGLHACAHGVEAMMALVALVEGGVLYRHPGLRLALLEAGSSWLPHWLWRLDEAWSVASDDVRRRSPARPSALVRRACRLGFEPGEPLLAEAVAAVGSDVFLFGTDFPHYDHRDGLVAQARGLASALGEAALGGATLARLLWGNAAALYGWAPPAAQQQPVVNGKDSPVSQ